MSSGITHSDSMFSVRERPWHGQGAILERPPASTAEAIVASGLDWQVHKEPIAVDRGDYTAAASPWQAFRYEPIEGFYATVRQDTRQVLGIVGARYEVIQNRDAFRWLDSLLGRELIYETAGSLHTGRRVWMLARLPKAIEVAGDPVMPYVLLASSHDGTLGVSAAVTPVRVVCQNTLNLALSRAQRTYVVRHTASAMMALDEARRVLGISEQYYAAFKTVGDRLGLEPCSERQLRAVLDQLYPAGTSDGSRARSHRQRVVESVLDVYTHGETQGNAPGSKWVALNAIVEQADWIRPLRSGDRFTRAVEATALKTKALQLVQTA